MEPSPSHAAHGGARRTLDPVRPLLVAAVVALGYLLVLADRVPALLPGHHNWDNAWDHQKYLDMAVHPFEHRIAPFSWRILGPLVARALPFDTATSFRVLTFAAVWLTAVAMFVLLRRLGHGDVLAGTGMLLLLSLWWVAGYPLYNFWMPDVLVILAVVVLAIAALDRRPVVFAVVLLLGALAKEQTLFAAPLWYTMAGGRLLDWRRAGRMVVLALPAVAAVLVVRGLLPAGNTDAAYLAQHHLPMGKWDHLPQDPEVLYETFSPRRLPIYDDLLWSWTANTCGVLPLLGVAALRRSAATLLRWAPYLALVYTQPLFASNTNRLISLACPVAVLLAVEGLAAFRRHLHVADVALLGAGASLLVLDLLGTRSMATREQDALALVAFLAGGAVVGIGRLAVARWRAGPPPETAPVAPRERAPVG